MLLLGCQWPNPACFNGKTGLTQAGGSNCQDCWMGLKSPGNERQLCQRQREGEVTWKELAAQGGGTLLSSFYSTKNFVTGLKPYCLDWMLLPNSQKREQLARVQIPPSKPHSMQHII